MKKTTIIALRTTVVTLVLTGLLYPLVITGLAQVLFPWRANGSLVTDDKGQFIGSQLIAQAFTNPAYFQPRPSAAGENGYDAASSGGSNLGPTSKKLRERVAEDVKRLKDQNPEASRLVPVELLTASGSGLDPHLSPQAALWQAPRIARSRNVAYKELREIVEANIEGRQLGFLDEPRINVLLLNLALDRTFGQPIGIQGR